MIFGLYRERLYRRCQIQKRPHNLEPLVVEVSTLDLDDQAEREGKSHRDEEDGGEDQ